VPHRAKIILASSLRSRRAHYPPPRILRGATQQYVDFVTVNGLAPLRLGSLFSWLGVPVNGPECGAARASRTVAVESSFDGGAQRLPPTVFIIIVSHTTLSIFFL